ncbi:MAG: hypothetical protein JO128_20980, partial [Alphaproteobacteria bacterium]|nr:hypothetical protein [Alphaproteobacteria bacterium]
MITSIFSGREKPNMLTTRRTFIATTFGLGMVASMPVAFADDRGTPEQAEALAKKAAQHVKEAGPEKAFAD